MVYADTDFFVALLKKRDWLKPEAKRLVRRYAGRIWTSPATLIELLLLSSELNIDPRRLVVDALQIAELRGGDFHPILIAAHYVKESDVNVFDALHAAFCGTDPIISSDKVFDRLGLERIPLEPGDGRRAA